MASVIASWVRAKSVLNGLVHVFQMLRHFINSAGSYANKLVALIFYGRTVQTNRVQDFQCVADLRV